MKQLNIVLQLFNSQSSRVVTLYGESHAKFWNLVREALRKIVPAEAFAGTNAKIDSFVAGVGTVLFYEDQAVVKSLQEQFELYADNFLYGLNTQVQLLNLQLGLRFQSLV